MSGPCSSWVTLGEVQADPRAVDSSGMPLSDLLLVESIDVTTELLWAHSGRQFSGVCSDVVRPLRRMYDAGNLLPPLYADWRYQWGVHLCGRPPERSGGCGPLSELTLGAYPIRSITEVRIDGQVLDPSLYRVDDERWLVYVGIDNPASGGAAGFPCCQFLYKNPLTDIDTFQVSFLFGQAPPASGIAAAKTFAIMWAKATGGDPCALPERLQSFSVNGASYQLLDPMTFLYDRRGTFRGTGIFQVDQFLAAYNPRGLVKRPSVISPDIGRPVRRTATGPGS